MPDKLNLSDSESAWLRKIAEYYEVTKELLIFGEQIDPENRTLAQTINELRNCLDHLMRVVSFKFGLREIAETAQYVETNMDKAFGHVYRAAYDTLDWVSLTIKDRIIAELGSFSLEAIQTALPEYYPRLRPRLEQIINEEITQLRTEKDVGRLSEENLVKYGQVVAELKGTFNTIIGSKSALIDCEGRLKRFQRKQRILRIAEHVTVGVLIGIVVYLLTTGT